MDFVSARVVAYCAVMCVSIPKLTPNTVVCVVASVHQAKSAWEESAVRASPAALNFGLNSVRVCVSMSMQIPSTAVDVAQGVSKARFVWVVCVSVPLGWSCVLIVVSHWPTPTRIVVSVVIVATQGSSVLVGVVPTIVQEKRRTSVLVVALTT